MPSLYLVKDEGSWNKFWRIVRSGNETTVTWGKVGTDGKTTNKEHKDDAAAAKFYDKMVKAKRKSGYESGTGDAESQSGSKGSDSEAESEEAAAIAPKASPATKRKESEIKGAGSASKPPAKKTKTLAGAVASTSRAPEGVCNGAEVVNNWIVDEARGLMVLPGKVKGGARIAGFDMDDTIITTASGNVFAKSETDWKFLSGEVPTVLKRLRDQSFKIVIFTNQAGIGIGAKFDKNKADGIKRKILAVSKALGFSVQAFVCSGYGRFRKPAMGMWEHMEEEHNDGVAVERAPSMYVGDAAGRQIRTMAGRKKDFSCGDRKFALNLGVRFTTPEELFLNKAPEAEFRWGPAFRPREHPLPDTPTEDGRAAFHKDRQEVVLNVGYPASGKSSFSKRHLVAHGYELISRDLLKTPAKCEKALKGALAAGRSAVVDNTSAAAAQRAPYIKIAKGAKVPIRCHHFEMSQEQAEHLNALRDIMTDGDLKEHVPGIAYRVFAKNFQKPEVGEGFEEIVTIRFAGAFKDERHRMLYNSYLQP